MGSIEADWLVVRTRSGLRKPRRDEAAVEVVEGQLVWCDAWESEVTCEVESEHQVRASILPKEMARRRTTCPSFSELDCYGRRCGSQDVYK